MILMALITTAACGRGKKEEEPVLKEEERTAIQDQIVGSWHTYNMRVVSLETGNVLYKEDIGDFLDNHLSIDRTYYSDGTASFGIDTLRWEVTEYGELIVWDKEFSSRGEALYNLRKTNGQLKLSDNQYIVSYDYVEKEAYKEFNLHNKKDEEVHFDEPVQYIITYKRGTNSSICRKPGLCQRHRFGFPKKGDL